MSTCPERPVVSLSNHVERIRDYLLLNYRCQFVFIRGLSLCASRNQWNLWLIFNQKCSSLKPKIEKSKKFLSPFFTSTYGNHKSRIDHFFRLKRAGSPYYRGTFFPSLSLPRVYPWELLTWLAAGECWLTCFSVEGPPGTFKWYIKPCLEHLKIWYSNLFPPQGVLWRISRRLSEACVSALGFRIYV